MRLTMILPTLDERANLERLVPELLRVEAIGCVLVVDDGSTDGTRAFVEQLSARDPRVRLLARDEQPSLRASLQAGIDAASTELVGWMDADGTMPVSDVVALLAAVDRGADVAIGSRFAAGGALKGQSQSGAVGRLASLWSIRGTADSPLAAAASLVLNRALLPLLLGDFAPRDWTSGFLVARKSVVAPVRLRGDHGEYFFDLWLRAERAGAQVVEIPCRMRPREHGRSKTATDVGQLLRRGTRYLARAAALRVEGWST